MLVRFVSLVVFLCVIVTGTTAITPVFGVETKAEMVRLPSMPYCPDFANSFASGVFAGFAQNYEHVFWILWQKLY